MTIQNTCISLVTAVAALVFCGRGVLCTPLCLAGDFDSQLRHILHTQMLSAQDPIISRVLDDVRATLSQRWQGYELTLCGSLGYGLGTTASDIDLVVKLPNFNASAGLYVLQETEKLFNKQPELYSQVRYGRHVNIIYSYISFQHIPSKRIVEIDFDTGVIYEHTQDRNLIKYYFELDKRFQPLAVFLKYWCKIHDVTGHGRGYLPGYALYLLIIFYLQQKNMAPPAYVLQVNLTTHYIDDWNLDFNELPYSTKNTENIHQLLGGFFKYYSEFNFEEYIVSPFAGRPIPKNAFTDIENFPKEYMLDKNTLNRTMQVALKNNLDTDISVQYIYKHDTNSAGLISHKRAAKFKNLMKSTTTMFKELPSDRILRAILVTSEQKETVISYNNATEEELNEQKCIELTEPRAVVSNA